MRLIVVQKANSDDFVAYFEGTHLYGYGQTRELAIADLVEKVKAILIAIGNIQRTK